MDMRLKREKVVFDHIHLWFLVCNNSLFGLASIWVCGAIISESATCPELFHILPSLNDVRRRLFLAGKLLLKAVEKLKLKEGELLYSDILPKFLFHSNWHMQLAVVTYFVFIFLHTSRHYKFPMSVYIYVYNWSCLHVRMHTQYVYIMTKLTFNLVVVYIWMCVCYYAYTYACMYVYIFVSICVFVCIFMLGLTRWGKRVHWAIKSCFSTKSLNDSLWTSIIFINILSSVDFVANLPSLWCLSARRRDGEDIAFLVTFSTAFIFASWRRFLNSFS